MANLEGEENYKEAVEEGEKGKEEASSSTVIGLRRYDSLDIEAAKFTSERSSKVIHLLILLLISLCLANI